MASGRLFLPGWMPARDSNGDPIPNVSVSFYQNGTDVLASVFVDETLTIPLPNPVAANSSGRFPEIYASDAITYSASVEAPYGPAGQPFTFDGLQVSQAADIAAANLAQGAAEDAETALQATLDAIEAATQTGGGSAAVAGALAGAAAANALLGGKANIDGSNATLAQSRSFRASLSIAPVSPENYGATGGGVVSDLTALNQAVASGRPVELKKGATYLVPTRWVIPDGAKVFGAGTIKAAAGYTDQFIVEISAGTNTTLRDFTVDGGSPAANVYGIRTQGSTVNLVLDRVSVVNAGFTGIDISSNTGTWTHTNLLLQDCRVENVPWIGISIEGGRGARLVRPYVRRTGYDAIAFREEGERGVCENADVSKATAPFRVFGGPEKGMLLHKSPDWELQVQGGSFIDNRNAGEDGIGVGEDGAEHRRWSVTGAYVKYAGLFGIDPAGNCVVSGCTVEFAAQQAIHLGLDLGGVMPNIVVSDNLILDANVSGGDSAILIGSTLLSAPMAVSSLKITDNIIRDRRATKLTLYGVGIDSQVTTYTGLSVTNNEMKNVGTTSFNMFGANGPGADYEAFGNNTKGFERQQTNPTPTAQTGTLGTVDGSAFRYQRRGKMVDFTYDLQLNATTGAGGSGSIVVPLPVNSRATDAAKTTVACSGVSFSGFNLLNAFIQDNNLYILGSGGVTAIANGLRVYVSGSYEAASAS